MLLPVLDVLDRDLLLLNRDLLLNSAKLLVLHLLLVVELVHATGVYVVDFIFERGDVFALVVCVADLGLETLPHLELRAVEAFRRRVFDQGVVIEHVKVIFIFFAHSVIDSRSQAEPIGELACRYRRLRL